MVDALNRARILIAVSVILAVGAAVTLINYAKAVKAQVGEMATVLAAAQPIPARTLITPGMLRQVELPRSYLHESLVSDLDTVSRSVSLISLQPGDLLVRSMLHPQSDMPADQRHVTLFAGKGVVFDPELSPGDTVDILASFRDGAADVTRLILSEVEVLAATPKAITLILTLDQAQQVIWMENYGKQLRILRRPAGQGG